jgi:Tfp pilus assembly protein PilN
VIVNRLNLSSHPFRNRTLPWTVAAVVACVSLLSLFFILAESRRARQQADTAQAAVEDLRKERAQMKEQADAVRQSVPPEQLRTLEAAHRLVERKSFSWSQLFTDLEASLPSGVRVARINVRDVSQRAGQTRAELELMVVGRTPGDVTGMMADMSRTGLFSVVPLSENAREGRGDSGIEWTLRVTYVQRARATGGNSSNEIVSTFAPPTGADERE